MKFKYTGELLMTSFILMFFNLCLTVLSIAIRLILSLRLWPGIVAFVVIGVCFENWFNTHETAVFIIAIVFAVLGFISKIVGEINRAKREAEHEDNLRVVAEYIKKQATVKK